MATITELIDLVTNTPLSIEDRVLLLRTVRNTLPDLVVPDRRLKGRIDSAQGVRPEYVDSAILGLESSDLWQKSASSNPDKLRTQRDLSDSFRLLSEEARALAETAEYNSRYQKFACVEGARAAHRVGRELTGEAAVIVGPHLEIMDNARQTRTRLRTKPPTPTPPAVKA